MPSSYRPSASHLSYCCQEKADMAYRPSTQKNHRYILRLFVGFAIKTHQDHTRPSVALITAFAEHLARNQRTAAAVVSTMTTLKALLARVYISTTNFDASPVKLMIRAIRINKRTPAIQRPPINPDHLRRIVNILSTFDYSSHLVVAALLLFMTNFRQSNLAPRAIKDFDSTRHLTRADIRLRSRSLEVYQKWSKTQQQVSFGRWIPVPRLEVNNICLYVAMRRLIVASPTIAKSQPLLTFDDGKPMTISFIARSFKLAVKQAGLAQLNFTLHSLRRGGACFLQKQGVKVADIASHGGWRSNAVYRYIHNPLKSAAFEALRTLK